MPDEDLRCDFCSRPIAPDDLAEGRAVVVFQKRYCPACMSAAIQKRTSNPAKAPEPAPLPAAKPAPIPQATRRLRLGEHGCGFYSSEEDRRHHLGPYLREGLEGHEKVLHFVRNPTPEKLLGDFRAAGITAKPYLDRGQLEVVPVDRLLGTTGVFSAAAVADRILQAADKALEDGWTRLRIAGEMTWALGAAVDLAALVDYEQKLSALAARGKCTALCQYNVYRFDATSLHAIRKSHPCVFVKGTAAMVVNGLGPAR